MHSHIFILDLESGFNRLQIDNCNTRQKTLKFCDLVHLILEIWRYIQVRFLETDICLSHIPQKKNFL